jgi:YidC/Oxa1 family membrane protein insertase
MKLSPIHLFTTLALVFFLSLTSNAQEAKSADAAPSGAGENAFQLHLASSDLTLDRGAFWLRQWTMNKPENVSLKTVTNYDSGLLMTFSGADYTYLNQQAASTLRSTGPSTYEWAFADDKVDYKRTYEIQGNTVLVKVAISFKQKAPEKAFLNIVSRGLKDDPEAHDRELFLFANSKIERHLVDDEIDPTEVASPAKWAGAGSRYFLFAVIPQDVVAEKILIQSTGPQNAQASMQFPVTGNQLNLNFKVAFAPKELDVLRGIDKSLDTAVNLGFFSFLAYPILWVLKFIYKFVGNYGVAIIILTILIKILTFPLVWKSMKGMRKMDEFQPKMKALQEKHKEDKTKFNQEMMLMMKETGYNPMAGCLPMLLQMPIFFALYSMLYAAVELYQAPFAWWIQDLSAKDPYYITPVLMTVTMFLQQKLTPAAPGMDPMQQKMMRFMPLMFGAFMLTTPSGLCIYMLVNAVVSVLQQQYLNKKLGVPPGAAGMAASF